ncbi:MAG TPA: ABC transporter permease subunit [Thermoanaerobaculia bacterium]|nr:ABC transporter permease subunit [Thermoanaerobaculia bacterium]
MAVYERTYRPYTGGFTAERRRFLVLPRYAYEEVFRSKLFLAFFVVCFIPHLAGAVLIYLRHNVSALDYLDLQAAQVLPIDGSFFFNMMGAEAMFCFLLALFVGPALIAPDLRNGALPLYLSRPFTRREYVVGKLAVLALLLSAITWVPLLLLFSLQASLEDGWLAANARIGWGIVAGSWAWILVLSLIALAVSAWVKWKPVARITLLVLFFVLAAFGTMLNETLDTTWGSLLNLGELIRAIWAGLLGIDLRGALAPGAAWAGWAAACAAALALLARRIKAYEVVR